ncbi:MAG: hypothetical protein RL441_858, partial [Actinomycetota bacterium]
QSEALSELMIRWIASTDTSENVELSTEFDLAEGIEGSDE